MDARSLLRAKKAEARIEHPYASYTARGELRCSICAIPVKQWDAHILTKQHRTSAAREKAQQSAKAAKSASGSVKRAAAEDVPTGDAGGAGGAGPSKRSKANSGVAALPEGFFSKGNERDFDDEDEGSEDGQGAQQNAAAESSSSAVQGNGTGPNGTLTGPSKETGDNELDDFLASLDQPSSSTLSAPPGSTAAADSANQTSEYSIVGQKRKHVPRYKELVPGQATYEAAPVRNVAGEAGAAVEETEPEETEAERRARVAREEREEIMQRLEEEERAQEDADSRVTMLKQRMEALKKRREAKQTAGSAKPVGAKGSNGV